MSSYGRLAKHEAEVLRLYANGVSKAEIARRFGVSHQAVTARLRVGRAKRRPRPSEDELRRLYLDERLSTTDIADRFGYWPSSVAKWLKAAGVKLRPRRKPDSLGREKLEQAIRLYVDEHRSTAEIAERLGVTATTIKRRLRAAGVELRPQGPAGMRPEVAARLRRNAAKAASKRRKAPPREELERLYHGERLSSHEIAERVGCSQTAVLESLARDGIPRRPPGWMRGEVRRRIARAAARENRASAEARRVERELERTGFRARCERCGRWVLQAPGVADGWANAMARLRTHLELVHGMTEAAIARALPLAQWRGGSETDRGRAKP